MILSDRESHKQPAICICATQHVIPCFASRVSSIRSKDERCIEENLLALAIGDLVEMPVLVAIRFIPLKSDTIGDDAVHDGRMVPQSAQFDKRPRKGSVAMEPVTQCNAWLNPPGLPEKELQKRTLTNLYNARPDWLAAAHRRLDAAVFAAYGWPEDLADVEILARLLALNLAGAE
jgi:hypothetical protein